MLFNNYHKENNLLTNFRKEEKALYEEAIKQYGDDRIYITDDAYWENGKKDNTLCALRCNVDIDLSEFWKIFRKLKYDKEGYNI